MPYPIIGLHHFLRQPIGMLEISAALEIDPVPGSNRGSPGSHVI